MFRREAHQYSELYAVRSRTLLDPVSDQLVEIACANQPALVAGATTGRQQTSGSAVRLPASCDELLLDFVNRTPLRAPHVV